jgi:hypothetical protein
VKPASQAAGQRLDGQGKCRARRARLEGLEQRRVVGPQIALLDRYGEGGERAEDVGDDGEEDGEAEEAHG